MSKHTVIRQPKPMPQKTLDLMLKYGDSEGRVDYAALEAGEGKDWRDQFPNPRYFAITAYALREKGRFAKYKVERLRVQQLSNAARAREALALKRNGGHPTAAGASEPVQDIELSVQVRERLMKALEESSHCEKCGKSFREQLLSRI